MWNNTNTLWKDLFKVCGNVTVSESANLLSYYTDMCTLHIF